MNFKIPFIPEMRKTFAENMLSSPPLITMKQRYRLRWIIDAVHTTLVNFSLNSNVSGLVLVLTALHTILLRHHTQRLYANIPLDPADKTITELLYTKDPTSNTGETCRASFLNLYTYFNTEEFLLKDSTLPSICSLATKELSTTLL